MNRFEMCEKLVELLGFEEVLDELIAAMSQYEAEELFGFIAQNHDIVLLENEEDEDGYED